MLKEMGFDLDPVFLARAIDAFPKTRVLVIGDIIRDEYLWADVQNTSRSLPDTTGPLGEGENEYQR